MARIRSIPAILLSVLLCAAFSGNDAAAADPSPWLEIHSSHYIVITDAGEKKGKEVALRFEQMRAVFASLLMKERLNEPVPLTILAFKSDKSYYQTAPLKQGQPIAEPGFFLPGEDQNFIVLNLFEPDSWLAVTHEFAHMLVTYNYPPVEGWFDEGLAEYFSSIHLDDRKYQIGGDPELTQLYKEDLLENEKEQRNPPKSLTELLNGQVWLTLPDLLTMKHEITNNNEGSHHTLFYAQSWITMSYLINQKKLPETGQYFDLVEVQHVPVQDAIFKAYGMSITDFDNAVKIYFRGLTPLFVALDASKQPVPQVTAAQPYEFPEPVAQDDREITAKILPVADAQALTAAVKIRIPERRDVGMSELKTLATTGPAAPPPAKPFANWIPKKPVKTDDTSSGPPLVSAVGNEIAHRALAWDHIERGEYDDASEELSDAAMLNQNDLWIRYYLCVMKYRIAQSKHADMSGLPNTMQDLKAVLAWYPEFAEAYDLLATAHREGGGPAAAMQAERAAIQLSPRDQWYTLHLAEIYISDKKWSAAKTLLVRLKTEDNPQLAAAARERLDTVLAEQKYGVTDVVINETPKLEPQKSPFDVLNDDAAKREAVAKTRDTNSTADMRVAKYAQGKLVDVDCSQSPAAILTLDAGGSTLKLRAADYKSLLVIGADAFSCTWSNKSVSVNYKPGGAADGDLVSIEVR